MRWWWTQTSKRPLKYLSSMLEEPFGDSSMLPEYYVCRMARQKVTVALSGDGETKCSPAMTGTPWRCSAGNFDGIPQWAGRLYRQKLHPSCLRDSMAETSPGMPR